MDTRFSQLLQKCVLAFMLLEIQWKKVFLAPVPDACSDNRTISQTALLEHETKKLLEKYIEVHGGRAESIPAGIPDPTVSGATVYEKLLDVHNKDILFYLHISKVEEYEQKVWKNQAIAERLSGVKTKLSYHLDKIKTILGNANPEAPLPPTPSPLQLSHDHLFAKKVYGWGVIVSLKDWLKQVSQVLTEARCS